MSRTTRKFLNLSLTTASMLTFPPPAHAENPAALFWLSGSWSELSDYITVGGCSSSPASYLWTSCGIGRRSLLERKGFSAAVNLVATDILLEIADKLDKKNQSKQAPIVKLLEKYDHAELWADARVSYFSPFFELGLIPTKVTGQFLLHNPNLPLASIALRQDLESYATLQAPLKLQYLLASAAVKLNYIKRKETIIEASLVDVASQAKDELVKKSQKKGFFGNASFRLELFHFFHVSQEFFNFGSFSETFKNSEDYLFIYNDKRRISKTSVSVVPSIWIGTLQLGATNYSFLDKETKPSHAIFGVFGVFLGPTSVVGSFAEGFLRTGLFVRSQNWSMGMGQEWKNEQQTNKGVTPKLTAEFEVRL